MPSVFERKKLAFAISIALSGSPLLLADEVVSEPDLDESNAQMVPPQPQLSPPQAIPTFDQTRVASPTVRKPVKVTGDPMSRIQSDFGDPVPDETMDRIMERFG